MWKTLRKKPSAGEEGDASAMAEVIAAARRLKLFQTDLTKDLTDKRKFIVMQSIGAHALETEEELERAILGAFDNLLRLTMERAAAYAEAEGDMARKRQAETVKRYEDRLETVRKASEVKLSQQAIALEANMNKKIEKLISGDSLASELQARISELTNEVGAQQQRRQGVEEALKEMARRGEEEEAEKLLAEERAKEMDEMMSNLKAIILKAMRTLKLRDLEINSLHHNAEIDRQALEEAKRELDEAENIAEQLQKVISTFEESIDKEAERAMGEAKAALNAQIVELQMKLDDAQGLILPMRSELEAARAELEETKELHVTVEQLRERIREMEEEEERLRAELENAGASAEEVEELAAAKLRVKELEEELSASRARAQQAETANASMSEELAEIEGRELIPRDQKIAQLVEELASRPAAVEQATFGMTTIMSMENTDMEALDAAFSPQMRRPKAPTPPPSTELDDLKAEVESLKVALKRADQLEASFKADLAAVNKQKTEAELETVRTKEQVDNLEQALLKAREELQAALDELKKWRDGSGSMDDMGPNELRARLIAMSILLDKCANASKAERANLVDVALSSLMSLRSHLTVVLAGMRGNTRDDQVLDTFYQMAKPVTLVERPQPPAQWPSSSLPHLQQSRRGTAVGKSRNSPRHLISPDSVVISPGRGPSPSPEQMAQRSPGRGGTAVPVSRGTLPGDTIGRTSPRPLVTSQSAPVVRPNLFDEGTAELHARFTQAVTQTVAKRLQTLSPRTHRRGRLDPFGNGTARPVSVVETRTAKAAATAAREEAREKAAEVQRWNANQAGSSNEAAEQPMKPPPIPQPRLIYKDVSSPPEAPVTRVGGSKLKRHKQPPKSTTEFIQF